MKNKQMIVMVDDEFLEKVEYIERINGYKNKSDTVRRVVEKEWRKEATMEGNFVDIDSLIRAFKKRWREEHPVYEDTSGTMTYPEIITFIRNFAEEKEDGR